jgi:hypothetical protein
MDYFQGDDQLPLDFNTLRQMPPIINHRQDFNEIPVSFYTPLLLDPATDPHQSDNQATYVSQPEHM